MIRDRLVSRLCAVVVTPLLVLGVLAIAPMEAAHAAPAAPTGLIATGGPIPTLSWDRVPGATRYVVQGAENSSFSTPVFNLETVNISYVPTRLLKDGILYWRVQAKDDSGSSDFTSTQTTIASYPAPTGIAITGPTGGAVLPPVSPPVIRWDSVAGATSYDVEVDNEGDGVGGIVREGVLTTTYVWPEPQGVGEKVGNEDFYVRIRARFENNLQTNWSPYVKYDVSQLPEVTSASCAAEAVCAPAPGSGVQQSKTVQDVVFDWDPVKGAKYYEIWVALDRDFNNQVDRRYIYGTRYSPASTYGNNGYYWKVRPINAADQPSPWPSEPSVFQRRWPDQPTQIWPPNTISTPVGDDFYYQWSPVRHASRYQVDISYDSGFSPVAATCFTTSTTLTNACLPTPGQQTFWRVRALDGPVGVQGIYSDTDPNTVGNQAGKFVYDAGPIQQVSPGSGVEVDVPTFRWLPGDEFRTYDVSVYNLNGDRVAREFTPALSWTPYFKLDAGDYRWTVRGIKGDGRPGVEYGGTWFSISGNTPGPTGVPLTPLPGVSEPVAGRFPQLRWQPIANAAYYKIKVSEVPGTYLDESVSGFLQQHWAYPSATDDGTFFLRPGTYTWRVVAFDATNVNLGTGSTSTFTIGNPQPATGQRIALNGRDLDHGHVCANAIGAGDPPCDNVPATPVLDWSPVPGADGYLVYLAEDPDFTNLVMQPVAVFSSRWNPTFALQDNQSGQAYYWFIRPCVRVADLNCGPDPISQTDAATNAFRKVSPRVELVAPAAGAVEGKTDITFSWTDYGQTNQGVPGNAAAPGVYLAGGDYPSDQTGRSYRLQVAQSATINDNNVIDDVTVDQTTYTAPGNLYPEGDLWWRVQSIDDQGNRLAWSETRKLTKATPTNNLFLDAGETAGDLDQTAFPVSGAAGPKHVNTGEFAFRWSPKDFDVAWQLEVYKNDDTTLSNANLVLSAYAKQAAFVPPAALPPSSEPYRWRVRRYDATGAVTSGRWSDLGRFYVDNKAVSLAGPANNATQPPNGPLLTWSPFATGGTQATRYAVDIRNSSNNSWDSIGSTSATAYAPVSAFPNGTYTWKVTAFDPGNQVMGVSETRSFVVDGAVSATASVQIQAPEGSGVGRTLQSTPPTWNHANVATTYQWLRNGDPIGGATGTTYVTTSVDQDKTITLQATGRLFGYVDGTSLSNAITVLAGASPTVSKAPSIIGKPEARETLTADPGTWGGNGTSTLDFTYQWFVGDQAVAKETGKTYVVRTRDAGLPVKVRVTASAVGYVPGEAFAAPVAVAKLASKTTATTATRKITQRDRAVLTIFVEMFGYDANLGEVKVMDGKKVLRTSQLKTNANGNIVVRLKKLKLGTHKLVVSYTGSTATNPSQAKPVVVKVVKLKK